MGEEDGQVNLQVGVLSGSLQKYISFNFYVLHLTALGKLAGNTIVYLFYSIFNNLVKLYSFSR